MDSSWDWQNAPRLSGAARERAKARVKAALLRRPPPRFLVGRYELGERLGQGASGTVYRARDPQLRRDVALKVVTLEHEQSRARCLAEGRALARLDHPNVVRIFDIGTAHREVFIAMELIPGETLRRWLASPRTPAEIVDVFVAAARGLAAAHAAGVVHRDFKPDNVIVGPTGVRVVDFGLARDETDVNQGSDSAGTPAYAAPEQHRGEAGPASDQFALCVALAEALTGVRPGPDDRVARGHGVPAPLRRALERGLRSRPEARFAGMDDLVGALGSRRSRVRTVTAVALAVAVLGIAGASTEVGARVADRRNAQRPEPAHIQVARVLLDEGHGAAAEQALADSQGARAEVIRSTLATDRGEYRRGEALALAAASRAAAAGDEETELAAWLAAVRSVGRQGRHGEALRLARTGEAVLARLGQPPEQSARVELATGIVQMGAGEYAEAERRLSRAADLTTGRTRGKALMSLGGVYLRQGRTTEGLEIRQAARAVLADALGDEHPDVAMADVSLGQAFKHLNRFDDARAHYARGLAGLERVYGSRHAELTIPLLNFGNLELFTGRFDEALALHRRYVEIVRSTLPEEHPEHGRAELVIGDSLLAAGRPDEALPHFVEGIRVAENRFGPKHFRTAWATIALAQAHSFAGDHLAATEGAAAGLALAEENWDPDSPQLLDYLLVAGEIALRADHRDQARKAFARAETIAANHDRADDLATARSGLQRASDAAGL